MQLNPAPQIVQRRTVLGFTYENGIYFGRSGRGTFKPRGLVIWGAPDDANVRAATIDMEEQVLQSMDGAPAKFFALGLSFEHIAQLVEEGVEPPSWCGFRTMQPGSTCRIVIVDTQNKVLGPSDGVRLAMWGINLMALELEPPTPPAELEPPSHANGKA